MYGETVATGFIENYRGWFKANGDLGGGVSGIATGAEGKGIGGVASATGSMLNYGGWFQANGNSGVAVRGEATATVIPVGNIGGQFTAWGNLSTGVFATTLGNNSVAVKAHAFSGTSVGVWSIGAASDFYAAGPGIDCDSASSIRWKRNIEEIDGALDKVMKMRGVYNDWDEEHGGSHDMGFVAEEVGQHVPEIVSYEPDGEYATGLDYGAMTPVLLQAIKEQQAIIEELKAEVDALKVQVAEASSSEVKTAKR